MHGVSCGLIFSSRLVEIERLMLNLYPWRLLLACSRIIQFSLSAILVMSVGEERLNTGCFCHGKVHTYVLKKHIVCTTFYGASRTRSEAIIGGNFTDAQQALELR